MANDRFKKTDDEDDNDDMQGLSRGAEKGDDYAQNIRNSLSNLGQTIGMKPNQFSDNLGSPDQGQNPRAAYTGNDIPSISPEQKARMDQIYANLHQMPTQPAKSAADYRAEAQEAPDMSKMWGSAQQPAESAPEQMSPEQKEMKKQALMNLLKQKYGQ